MWLYSWSSISSASSSVSSLTCWPFSNPTNPQNIISTKPTTIFFSKPRASPQTSLRAQLSDRIAEVVHNKVLIAAGVSAAIGQLSKPFTSVFLYGKDFDIKATIQAGGFPSTHSSAVVAAATCLGLERGFSDSIFGLTVVYAGLIMYDAQILGKQEVPCFNEVVTLVRGEESRRGLMLEPQSMDNSAMVVRDDNDLVTNVGRAQVAESGKPGQSKAQNRDYKDSLWCIYCKKACHTRERCWKLHGKPPSREWGQKGEQPRNNGQAHVATIHQNEVAPKETSGLNQEEVERVRSFIGNLEKPSGICSLAYSGEFPSSIGLNV